MDIRVVFSKHFPVKHREAVKADVEDAAHGVLGGRWRVNVHYSDADEQTRNTGSDTANVVARIETLVEYRELTLFLYAAYFDLDPQQKWETLIHEFVHVLVEPLMSVVRRLIEFVPGVIDRELQAQIASERMEEVVTSITHALT